MQIGYPNDCEKCFESVRNKFSEINIEGLKVKAYFKKGNNFKLMLIGQDPTIKESKERVQKVLMLDQENGQFRKWLRNLFGASKFDSATIYATNTVKCSFSRMPSELKNGGRELLKECFKNCCEYLKMEVKNFSPNLVLSFGEPAHEMFRSIIKEHIPEKMNDSFTGKFHRVSIDGVSMEYSPCLHILTFRIAEKYGRRVEQFKELIYKIETP